jgi:large subunit ribosomal protein L10
MAISKGKKGDILERLKKIFNEAKSVTFVNFHGLSVAKATDFRRKLREENVGYFVAKKTLIRKALEAKKVDGVLPDLQGEVGVAWSDDLTAPARETFSFAKKIERGLRLIGGIFDGKFMDEGGIKTIALIPSVKTLRAQFVNVINSPIRGFVMALDQIAKAKTAN